MSDSQFYNAFKNNMDAIGLPAPASLFGTFATAVATTNAIASGIAKLGMRVTLRELLWGFPIAARGTALAAAVAEGGAVLGALAASFYLGACIGSLIAAAIDTWGIAAFGKLRIWLAGLAKKLNMSVAQFMDYTLRSYPNLSSVRTASDQVRSLGGHTNQRYA